MDTATTALAISAVGLAITVGLKVFDGGWGLSSKLSAMELKLSRAIAEVKEDIDSRSNQATHNTGETIAALRQKIHDVELYASNNFMRRESFYEVNRENTQNLKSAFDKIDARLERMEAKIDSQHS